MRVGTFSGGVHYYNSGRPRFRHINLHDSGNAKRPRNVLAVSEDQDGNVYTRIDGGGLNAYHRSTSGITTLQHHSGKRYGIPSNYPLWFCTRIIEQRIWMKLSRQGWLLRGGRKANRLTSLFRQISNMSPLYERIPLRIKYGWGTWGEGVLVYDPPTATWKQHLPHNFKL